MKGATLVRLNYVKSVFVSIHAPMKGATKTIFDGCIVIVVSIHAPMKGATGFFCTID